MNISSLAGKKVLLTTGLTNELIDPIQLSGGTSLAKIGLAITRELLLQGAEIFLISGPHTLDFKDPSLITIQVNSASEIYFACCDLFEEVDVAIFADHGQLSIAPSMVNTTAISFTTIRDRDFDNASEFGRLKSPSQLSVGFIPESQSEIRIVEDKLVQSNFDLVIVNTAINDAELDNRDLNKVTIIKRDHSRTHYPAKLMKDMSEDIVFEIGIALSHAELAQWEEKEQAYEMLYR